MRKPYFTIQSCKSDKKLERFIESVRRDLSKFFMIKLKWPCIFFVDSRKLYDELKQSKSKEWMVGNANGNNIFIFDIKNMEKYSPSHKGAFWKVLKHEYVHIATSKFGCGIYPRWLHEGLACYLAGQTPFKPDLKTALEVLNYKKFNENVYKVGYFWVKLLLEKYGKKKFLKFLKGLRKIDNFKNFKSLFYKIYKIKFERDTLKKIYQQQK